MLKKSTFLLSYNCLHQLHPPAAPSKITQRHPSGFQEGQQSCRYATTSKPRNTKDSGIPPWPNPRSFHDIPTPYEIFNQTKGSPYCKQRFYELVKYYHPDRHCGDTKDGLSHSVRLERYRLIIVANDILSDPIKRGAYDIYGAGWNGQPEAGKSDVAPDQPVYWGNYSYKGWGPEWEQDFTGKGPSGPRYMSNSAFLFLIFLFATLGGFGQATRAGNYSMTILEHSDAIHDNMSKDLMRRRKETTSAFTSRQERIYSFLKQRDPGANLGDPKEEGYRPLLPPPSISSPGDAKSSSLPVQDLKHGTDNG